MCSSRLWKRFSQREYRRKMLHSQPFASFEHVSSFFIRILFYKLLIFLKLQINKFKTLVFFQVFGVNNEKKAIIKPRISKCEREVKIICMNSATYQQLKRPY